MFGIPQDCGIGVFLKMKKKRQKNYGHKHRPFVSDYRIQKCNPCVGLKGINKIKFFKKILSHILLYALDYISGIQERYNKRVRREPHSLEFIPDDYKTQKMCNEGVEADPCLLKLAPVHLRTHCFKVVEKRKAQKEK